jgi:hypothetical protein
MPGTPLGPGLLRWLVSLSSSSNAPGEKGLTRCSWAYAVSVYHLRLVTQDVKLFELVPNIPAWSILDDLLTEWVQVIANALLRSCLMA